MTGVVFLTQRMKMGYGVDLAVHEVSERLAAGGVSVSVLCNDADATFRGRYEIVELERGTPGEVQAFAEDLDPQAVVACTSPFIEMLPLLRKRDRSWAWEYGEPTPELFGRDGVEREMVRQKKNASCYPAIAGIIAISEFIREDIHWPGAHVAYLGCDHVPDPGTKGVQDIQLSLKRPLRVGTLMRLGQGEARYKGNDLFCRLAETLSGSGHRFELSVMGRGAEHDAEAFRRSGCRVFLNATDREKWDYLRALDVFVSCSLWEGFNLPLVEAQAIGTMAVAFDTGAHPEVCPLIFPNSSEMADFLCEIETNRSLLLEHSRAGYHFVRRSFRWHKTASRFRELVLGEALVTESDAPANPQSSRTKRSAGATIARTMWAAWRSLRLYGLQVTVRKIQRRLGEAWRTR
ncbi:MAG: hypothetical protein BMS9Abin37_1310 [Acidobacteriota bacterium]|nr:MAG: hypothetical protein BMS9Abin37_1310 [Acidobacteriota bacterium]